ncbi:membrane protein [Actinoplanes sp. OR16]|uniref:tripartite tricarboxylate transporter TctB family protein n=1 Tax=Actinoplanes sp. OR16 TaxID=946334 RepID=UPI000F6D2222|nr:tripartite tricarboxylate transporter TctB family protein [Actinoplanes sp. OR16]BBH68815.1 membrane protein [Actinoplanes sp. OR16]
MRGSTDLLAGGIFTVIGGAFVAGSLSHDRGTLLRMGPGFFPLVVGVIVAVLGLAIMFQNSGVAFGAIPWRAVILIVAAVGFFGYFVRRLGFVPTSFVTALLTALAEPRWVAARPVRALVVAAGLTVAATLIFVVGLRLRIPLWWF